MSYTSIQTFLGDVLGLPLSTDQIAKIMQKASAAFAPSHAELKAALPQQTTMNIDETGHPENGKKRWAWGFHAPCPQAFTWFHIDPSWSTEVLHEFPGEIFSGVIDCDHCSVYRKFLAETDAMMQFCWANVIRDVKFLTTDPTDFFVYDEVLDPEPEMEYECPHCGTCFGEGCVGWNCCRL
jgi:hypothetical protein